MGFRHCFILTVTKADDITEVRQAVDKILGKLKGVNFDPESNTHESHVVALDGKAITKLNPRGEAVECEACGYIGMNVDVSGPVKDILAELANRPNLFQQYIADPPHAKRKDLEAATEALAMQSADFTWAVKPTGNMTTLSEDELKVKFKSVTP